jgi:hypothetical protein
VTASARCHLAGPGIQTVPITNCAVTDLTIKERAGSLTPGRSRPHPANRPVASYPATAAMEVISVTLAPADAAELAAMLQFLSDWLSRDRDHLEPPLESSSVLNP